MDENHQDKTKSTLTTIDNKLWVPPLSPKVQKKLKRLQKKPFAERLGFAGKTLWDWLQLLGILAIPAVVALASILFSMQQSQMSEAISQKQHQTDLQIAQDQQQEMALQTYLDRMSELLLDRN